MILRKAVHWLVALLLCCLSHGVTPAFAADRVLDASRIVSEPVVLTEYFDVLEDPSTALTLADVQRPDIAAGFKPSGSTAQSLNFAYTTSAYWLRFQLRNDSDQPLDQLLEIANARLADVKLYGATPQSADQALASGDALPFAQRPYAHRFIVFPLALAPKAKQTLYLRVDTLTPMDVPAKLWQRSAFLPYERHDYILQAAYFGMVVAMILFNLLLFASLRDVSYLIYILWVSFIALCLASSTGLGNEFIWDGYPQWTTASFAIFGLLAASALILFTRKMISVRTAARRADTALLVLAAVNMFILPGLFLFYQLFAKLALAMSSFTVLFVLAIAIYCVKKGQHGARWFALAFLVVILAVIINALRLIGVVPSNLLTANGLQIGSAIEMILLAFALADRFHILRAEKEKAQNAAIDAQAAALQAQAEKMSSLTQLVSNVAHEINTPIGAIKSSGSFIAAELKEETAKTLQLATWLGDSERELFIQLISQAKGGADALSSREKRSLSKRVVEQLAAAGVPDAEQKAQVLVRLQAHKAALNYLPLLVHPQSAFIFDTASGIAAILGGTQNIGTAVDRVAKIVTTLKAFAQAGASEVMQPVVLKDGIEVVLASYHSQLKQGVVVVRQYEDVPAVSGHTEELRQAWTHLIHNALQAMAYRGRLAIAVRRVGDEAVVDISDTGSGIADEILPRIFEPFFSTKPQGEGSGLGLSVVKKIVEQHHGRIEVKTAVGVGSTFSVHLPLHTAT